MKTFSALANLDFRRYWLAQSVSLVGGAIQNLALAWLVMSFSSNQAKAASNLGLILALQFAPSLFLSVFAGVLSDRLSRKKILLTSQALLTIIAFSLAIITFLGVINLKIITITSLLIGIINAFDFTARQSLVSSIVERKFLTSAIALNSFSFNTTKFLGSGLFILLVPLGIPWLFLLNALSFSGVLITIVGLPIQNHQNNHRNPFSDIKLGFAYVTKSIKLRYIIIFLALMSLTAINFLTIIPVFAKNGLNLKEGGYGFLQASYSCGAIISSLWQAQNAKLNKESTLYIGAGFLVVGLMILSFSYSQILASIGLIICGIGNLLFNTSANSIVQLLTPNIMRGRVMSIYNTVFNGMTPFGSLLVGSILMANLGPRVGLLVITALTLVISLWFGPKISRG